MALSFSFILLAMPCMYLLWRSDSPHISDVYKLSPGDPLSLLLILTQVRAGFPSPAADYVEEVLDLNDLLIKNPPATFMMRVAGESMKDASIHDGDLLVVDRSVEPTHGDIVIALLDGDLTVKRLFRRGRMLGLIADNDAHPNIPMQEGMELEVWGVVMHVIRSL